MKTTIYTLITVLFLAGCSATPKLNSLNGIQQNQTSYIGEITAVGYERKSSLIEDFGSFVVGDTIGEQFGGGSGKDMLGFMGGVLASDLYEEKFANEYTKLEVKANGKTYPVYVKGRLKLNQGRKVKISVKGDKISGIELLK